MKKMISLVLVMALCLGLLVSCSASQTTTAATTAKATTAAAVTTAAAATTAAGATTVSAIKEEDLKIMIVAKNLADPFCNWLITMCTKRMTDQYPKIKFKMVDQQGDPANSQPIIDQAILGGYNAMVYQKVSGSQNTDAMLQAAAAKGLKVCIVNNPINDGVSCASFAPEFTMGSMIGAEAAKNLPQNAKVVVLMSTPSLYASEERRKGYEEALFKKRPDVTILDTKNVEAWNKAIAISTMDDWCQRFPQIDGVISMNDGMVLGAIEAAKADKRDLTKMQFYGIDGLADGCLSIQKGELTATILQDAVDMGYSGVDMAVKIAKGEITKPTNHEIVPVLITKSNIETYIKMHKDTGVIK